MNQVGPTTFASRSRLPASLHPWHPPSACGAARLLVRVGTRFRVCASREDYHSWARSPFTDSPVDVGNALLRTVAAYRFLQTRFEVRAHLRVPSSSPASEAETPHGVLPLLRSQRTVSGEAGPLQRAEQILPKAQTFDCQLRLTAGHGNPSRSTEVSEGLVMRVPLLVPLPCTTLSPTRCREKLGVSSAAPCLVAPFGRKRCAAFHVG